MQLQFSLCIVLENKIKRSQGADLVLETMVIVLTVFQPLLC